MISVTKEPTHLVYNLPFNIKLKIKYDNSSIYPWRVKEPRVKNHKYVHLMNNGLHSVGIIQFINKYLNENNEHCFIFPCIMFDKTKLALLEEKNVYYCPITNIDIDTVDKIVIHGLFDPKLVNALYKNRKYLLKTYWFIWGGDLYAAPRTKEHTYVRKNIAGILTCFDKDIYEAKYGLLKQYFDVTYPHDITEAMLSEEDYEPHDCIHIQVNNSADETTIEMLEILSKFKDENIKVSTILSYNSAGHQERHMQIMRRGYEIFKHKFNPITEFMPKEDYAKHLASVDIYISNQNRQQGNGNASFICSLGKKVYTKSNTSVYQKYNELGIRYYDTYEIKDMSFEEFCYMDPVETERSVKLLKERMKDETKVKQWKDFFDYKPTDDSEFNIPLCDLIFNK